MKVDIHTHFIPPVFVEAARRGRAFDDIKTEHRDGIEWMVHPQGYGYPLVPAFYDVGAKLQHMESLGIDVSVLSISPTLFLYWTDAGTALEFSQLANEAVAEMAAEAEGSLYGMATVPMQDPEAAAQELRRAVQELGLRGVEIGTEIEDEPLEMPRFEPFFAAAEELGVPVLIHPYYVGTSAEFADYYMTNLVGNPLKTAVAAARLILSGFLDRHPDLDVVLMHGGGYLPYQIGRFDHGFRVRPETSAVIDAPPSTYLRRFYFDTITHASVPLEFLVKQVGADRVVLGTDIPFDMADVRFGTYFGELEIHQPALDAIKGGNAVRLFDLET